MKTVSDSAGNQVGVGDKLMSTQNGTNRPEIEIESIDEDGTITFIWLNNKSSFKTTKDTFLKYSFWIKAVS